MTFPLLLYRGQASFSCILSLSAALYDAPHYVFIHGRDRKAVCEYSGKSSPRLTPDTVMIQLGGQHGVTCFFIEEPFSMMTVNLSGR